MTVTYIANSWGHISSPFADELYRLLGDDFHFIATAEMSEDRKLLGFEGRPPYLLYTMEGEEAQKKAQALCDDSDVVIFGFAPYSYIANRVKRNKLTLYYSEKLFKNGFWRFFNPVTFRNVYQRFIKPSRQSNVHLLCASSFAPLDFHRVGAFRGKMYKWGYQPKIDSKDVESLMKGKEGDEIRILWVGRLVALKHCDDAIRTVWRLRRDGVPVVLDIIGTGEEESALKALCASLKAEDCVTFHGVCPVERTREQMDRARIFLFTSDAGEGWGATLNEAMNSGCACVASHAAGSTAFLVRDQKDALVYRSGDLEDLYRKTQRLAADPALCETLGRTAYRTITEQWNVEHSAPRFLELVKALSREGDCRLFPEGPCSKAQVIPNDWYPGKGE